MSPNSIREAHTGLSNFKDPFAKDCIVSISTYCFVSFDKREYTGSVEFKNGDTKGEQEFEGTSLTDVLKKMEAFVEQL